jgi:phosphoserine aminotransferase
MPIVCDASSNILSKPIDIEKYALIYAGAQKNIGPSGVTIVIVSATICSNACRKTNIRMLDYRAIAAHDSMLNTPNTWGIYIVSLVCEWLKEKGGVAAMEKINREKARVLYESPLTGATGFIADTPKNRRAR